MAERDYMSASPGARAARKTPIRISQEPDMTQPTSGQKLVFQKGHDPNNVNIEK